MSPASPPALHRKVRFSLVKGAGPSALYRFAYDTDMLIRSVSDWNGGHDDGRPLVRQYLFVGDVQIGAMQFTDFEQWLEWMAILRNVPVPHMVKFEGNAEVTRAECIWTEIDRLDMKVRIKRVTSHPDYVPPTVTVSFNCPGHEHYKASSGLDLPTALQGMLNNLKEIKDADKS